MFVARAYRISPDDGGISETPSVVLFGHSEKLLRRKLERKPDVKKVTKVRRAICEAGKTIRN